MSFLLALPLIVIMRRRPEDIGLLPDGASQEEEAATLPIFPGQESGPDPEFSWTIREAIRTRAFWLVTTTSAFGPLASGAVGFSLVPYLAEDVGISKGTAAGVLSLATFLAIGNLGWAYLADWFTPRRCLVVALVVSGVMVL